LPDVEPVKLSAEEVRRALTEEAERHAGRRLWEPWEDQVLRDFHGRVPYRVLAQKLRRSQGMIYHRLEKLGLIRQDSQELSPVPNKQRAGREQLPRR